MHSLYLVFTVVIHFWFLINICSHAKGEAFPKSTKSSLQPPTNSLPSTNPAPTNETSSHTSMSTTPPIDSSLPTENSQQPETSTKHVQRESSSYWTIHAIGICHLFLHDHNF